ncbi:phosphodiester glycosidase family protein [Paenibacillus sp.]|jgi:exopolysaccharide biosynthesis protein|uniref:phosphodiester glycosidase family protein n=1 Tax=Paenibacillus sp. TaxID=58172 RepID=UPI002826D2D9|nr:phosphodiester glycosidase family protein [Paenibacillus sp.]MDR0268759.1 phosphodiester glycosidase family protein [Paenibacillus sp.]
MITKKKQINRFFLLATAPFLGLFLFMLFSFSSMHLEIDTAPYVPEQTLAKQTAELKQNLDKADQAVQVTISSIRKTSALYKQTTAAMNQIVNKAQTQAKRPEYIYNRKITSKLGTPFERIESDRIRLELYKVNPGVYRGYAMKVKLKDPKAMQMSLGLDQVGGSETTLRAVNRYGAVAGINAGGFADSGSKRYPLSTTVLNAEYVTGFEPSFKDLFFVGLNDNGKLIGGKFSEKAELDRLEPRFGATFVPVLLKNGQPMPIPEKWLVSPKRAPRTVIGNYKDDQLLIIVVDGYNENGSSGATLQELQSKLYGLGVIDAYNLDGGGSSSLIVNGKVVNHPSDGSLRPVPTHFLFYK